MKRNGRSSKPREYNVSDGKLLLTLTEDEGGWYCVTSPMDPALITQAKSIPDAFEMAYDALRALRASRSDPNRWNPPQQHTKKSRKRQMAAA